MCMCTKQSHVCGHMYKWQGLKGALSRSPVLVHVTFLEHVAPIRTRDRSRGKACRLDSLHVARPRPDGARPSCIQERCETLVGRRCGKLVVFILAVLLSSSSQLLRVTVPSRSRGQSRHVCFNKVFSPPPRLLRLALTMAVTRRRLSYEKL